MIERINTLLVDNGSESIISYRNTFKMCDISVVPYLKLNEKNNQDYQLIILSDGHPISANKNFKELELIKSSPTPIIGICYGFQLLCVAHGIELTQLPQKREGSHKINILTNHPMFKGVPVITSVEKHKFAVKNIDGYSNLICHAISSDGCEIIEVEGKKQFGFQFHPEIDSSNNQGSTVIENLLSYLFPVFF